MNDARFWSDDFDMDLPKVIPEARRHLGEYADLEMVTHGHTTHSRLNHPSVWNHHLGSIAFFGRVSPMKPHGYSTSDPLVRCTLWEAIRDAWCHDFILIFEGRPIWDGDTYRHFEPLMYHVRGWRQMPEPEANIHRVRVLRRINACRRILRGQLGRECVTVDGDGKHG